MKTKVTFVNSHADRIRAEIKTKGELETLVYTLGLQYGPLDVERYYPANDPIPKELLRKFELEVIKEFGDEDYEVTNSGVMRFMYVKHVHLFICKDDNTFTIFIDINLLLEEMGNWGFDVETQKPNVAIEFNYNPKRHL